MMKKIIVLAVLISAVAFSSLTSGAAPKSGGKGKEKEKSKEDLYSQVELFANAVSIIRSDYVDEVDSKKIVYGALKGMLESLDDFSSFLDPEEFKEIQLETKGEFGGIGVEISHRDGILTIIAPIAATPAETAGIKAQDRIVKINDKITKDMTLNDAVKLMRGEPGTQVKLTVWREKEERIIEFTIKRDVIKVKSVKSADLLDGKTGYIKLAEFQENTPHDLEEAIKKLEKEGMDSLILDLRNNPGGLLDVSVDVAERFLPKDAVIVSIKSRTPEQNAVFKSSGKFYKSDYPLVVLVNEGSASASEIVAGAIQDTKRGLVLGTKTFGKASVQTVIPLRGGSALRVTTATYFTPAGRMIRNQGIIPDIVVTKEETGQGNAKKKKSDDIFEKLDEKEETIAKKDEIERDNQLKLALNSIKAIKVYKGRTP